MERTSRVVQPNEMVALRDSSDDVIELSGEDVRINIVRGLMNTGRL